MNSNYADEQTRLITLQTTLTLKMLDHLDKYQELFENVLKAGEEYSDVPETIEQARMIFSNALSLMFVKNKDYGDSWRQMRPSSITDQILTKVIRIIEMEKNGGHSEISEGINQEYYDILNYAVFALIKLENPQTDSGKGEEIKRMLKNLFEDGSYEEQDVNFWSFLSNEPLEQKNIESAFNTCNDPDIDSLEKNTPMNYPGDYTDDELQGWG